ncbi:MAG: HAD-IA family hydrolase [Candidatus Omnitrophota bacterium]
MIKAVIFDFDGVIVESVDIKTDAFRELFNIFPDKVDEIVKYHADNGGISRFNKFRYIYEHILRKPLPKELFDRLCDDFARLVKEKVASAPFVRGAEDFIGRNFTKYHFYIVSGTPETELVDIIKLRGMEKYFRGIYGAPRSKAELLRKILADNGFSPEETIFLGDSINDYEAAKKASVPFAARIVGSDDPLSSADVEKKFNDLSDIEAYL